jgi:hypothetical protein
MATRNARRSRTRIDCSRRAHPDSTRYPLRVRIEGEVLEVGTVEQTIVSATVVEIDGSAVYIDPYLNDTVHERLVDGPQGGWAPAGKTAVRARRYPPADAEPTAG